MKIRTWFRGWRGWRTGATRLAYKIYWDTSLLIVISPSHYFQGRKRAKLPICIAVTSGRRRRLQRATQAGSVQILDKKYWRRLDIRKRVPIQFAYVSSGGIGIRKRKNHQGNEKAIIGTIGFCISAQDVK